MGSPNKYLAYLYLFLSLLGAILPTLANIDFMMEYGPAFDIQNFIRLANINPAAQSLSRDLFVVASAIMVWMFSESKRLNMRNFWVIFISTFIIAIAFSAPLFLFLRERRLLELRDSKVLEIT